MRTASLVNSILETSPTVAAPRVGDGATILMWTDRKACTIVEVSANGKRIVLQYDSVTRVDSNGMSDAQRYEYAPNPNTPRQAFTLRTNGRWIAEGAPAKDGTACLVGHRSHYFDFSF